MARPLVKIETVDFRWGRDGIYRLPAWMAFRVGKQYYTVFGTPGMLIAQPVKRPVPPAGRVNPVEIQVAPLEPWIALGCTWRIPERDADLFLVQRIAPREVQREELNEVLISLQSRARQCDAHANFQCVSCACSVGG